MPGSGGTWAMAIRGLATSGKIWRNRDIRHSSLMDGDVHMDDLDAALGDAREPRSRDAGASVTSASATSTAATLANVTRPSFVASAKTTTRRAASIAARLTWASSSFISVSPLSGSTPATPRNRASQL